MAFTLIKQLKMSSCGILLAAIGIVVSVLSTSVLWAVYQSAHYFNAGSLAFAIELFITYYQGAALRGI